MSSSPHDPPSRTEASVPLSDSARRALLTAGVTYRAAVEALRTAICAYVEDLRREGTPRDTIAAAVRRFVADLRAADPAAAAAAPSRADEVRLDQLVAECLALGAGSR
jgi:hypothetical protein